MRTPAGEAAALRLCTCKRIWWSKEHKTRYCVLKKTKFSFHYIKSPTETAGCSVILLSSSVPAWVSATGADTGGACGCCAQPAAGKKRRIMQKKAKQNFGKLRKMKRK